MTSALAEIARPPSIAGARHDDSAAALRILVHDFSGHPFQVQLSRDLARRGHVVRHLHCASETTGKGALTVGPDDPPSFDVRGIALDGGFRKYALISRWRQERFYGDRVIEEAVAFNPDVILSANTPLFAQQRLGRWAAARDVGFVFWVQDVLSAAVRSGVGRRVPGLGPVAGRVAARIEGATLGNSDGIVIISPDFLEVLASWGIGEHKVAVIENWAPLDELPLRPRRNPWSREHGLDDRNVVMYSGTLGMKHDPALLVQLAETYRDRPDTVVVIVSEGRGATWIADEVRHRRLTNVVQLPYQPYAQLPDVLATADVLLAILEPDAGQYSVPSKVLSYHCAGRSIVAAVPASNLAARVIAREGSGTTVDPARPGEFIAAVTRLLDDPDTRAAMGARARGYAERAFDISAIGTRFEQVLRAATHSSVQYHDSRKAHA